MQLLKLAGSYISLHAVPFFVWEAHKNFAVLVLIHGHVDICFSFHFVTIRSEDVALQVLSKKITFPWSYLPFLSKGVVKYPPKTHKCSQRFSYQTMSGFIPKSWLKIDKGAPSKTRSERFIKFAFIYIELCISMYRVFRNNHLKIVAYCSKIKGPGDSLGLLAAHQIWSVW